MDLFNISYVHFVPCDFVIKDLSDSFKYKFLQSKLIVG